MWQIAFRVDASREIGSGHVMRCLTLADSARNAGARACFVCRELPGHLGATILERGFELKLLPPPSATDRPDSGTPHGAWLGASTHADAVQTAAVLGNEQWDWLVVDHYALDTAWERQLRSKARFLMVIDDLADRQHDCNVLLDQNLWPDAEQRYLGKLPQSCQRLLGPAFALLRPEFAEARQGLQRDAGRDPARILISFGGTDMQGYTRHALEAFAAAVVERPGLHADVVVGRGNAMIDELAARCAAIGDCTLHVDTRRMAELMAAADVSIGAGGSTTWERACLGLPTIIVPIAANQTQLARYMADIGAAVLVEPEQATTPVLNDVLRRCLADRQGRDRLSQNSFRMVDGLGADRVVRALSECGSRADNGRAVTTSGE